MDPLELLKKKAREGTEVQLNETISKGALKLTDEQTGTVSFVFWLVYMAETDLNDVISEAWQLAKKTASPEVQATAKQMLEDMIKGERKIDIENLEYFVDKIKVYEAMFGKNKHSKLFWKLNDIRNDLSHNRIDGLKYEGLSLSLRSTKEKVLFDYFDTMNETDSSKSKFWNSFTPEEKKVIEEKFRIIQQQKG